MAIGRSQCNLFCFFLLLYSKKERENNFIGFSWQVVETVVCGVCFFCVNTLSKILGTQHTSLSQSTVGSAFSQRPLITNLQMLSFIPYIVEIIF